MSPFSLQTRRILLRRWHAADRFPFAVMNADPRVMKYFPALMTPEESERLITKFESHFEEHGFGLWALEIPGVAPFAGFVGLSIPRFEAPFTPCVEIGWRLSADFWGQGYATEGAQAVLEHGFTALHLREIVSFTVPANVPSRRVMERIRMIHNPREDFDHPALPEGDPLRRHVLYRTANRAPSAGRR